MSTPAPSPLQPSAESPHPVKDIWVPIVTTLLAVFLTLILTKLLESLAGEAVFWGILLLFAVLLFFAVGILPIGGRIKTWLRVAFPILALLVGLLVQQNSQPRFEITALQTLSDDPNVYELTDMLYWNRDNLENYGVQIAFPVEIHPLYSGKRTYGSLVARIRGAGQEEGLVKPLWDDFSSGSQTKKIQLTLPEVIAVSGLQVNANPPHNIFGPGDQPYEKAAITIEISRETDPDHPFSSQEIALRNSPWEQQSRLVWRGDHYEVDVYLKNQGAGGQFAWYYRVVRQDKEVTADANPSDSGTTTVEQGHFPDSMVAVKAGGIYTDTLSLEKQAIPGRYLVELYAVKRQNYAALVDQTWDDLSVSWWFSRAFDRLPFVTPNLEYPVDQAVQAELDRLQKEAGVDLGPALSATQEVTSDQGTPGKKQVFKNGEVYGYGGNVYAVYGQILETYRQMQSEEWEIGFPTSPIRKVQSSTGLEGLQMEFEGLGGGNPPTYIYASSQGAGIVEGWICQVYLEKGGHAGWLGFPISLHHYYEDSEAVLFQTGYIVYYYPKLSSGERDWDREPLAYPYVASTGKLVDVQAGLPWQDTGIDVKTGDRVTVFQVGGSWTNYKAGGSWFDANGSAAVGLLEGLPVPTAYAGALIGKVGSGSGNPFLLGRLGTAAASAGGRLYLSINDNLVEDNEGTLTVQVTVERGE